MGNSNSSQERSSNAGSRKKAPAAPILIPPSFGVGPSDKMPLTLQMEQELHSTFQPDFFRNVQVTDPSYRLLTDHMQPGLWIQSKTSKSKVSASLQFSKDDNDDDSALAGGTILGERSLSDAISAQIRGGTQMGPCLSADIKVLPGFSLRAAANTAGKAWVSGIGSYNIPTVRRRQQRMPLSLVGATWLPLDLDNTATTTTKALLSDKIPQIHAFGAVRVAGMTAAVQSQCSTETWELQNNQLYWTLNFTDDERGPPLQISLQQQDKNVQTLALSQTVSFDRYQLNPVEDRADYVRNTAGWTVQLQSRPSSPTNAEATAEAQSVATATMAGAWQVNRAVALKAIVQPQQHSIDLAVILKRWRHPRITCSILTRHNWSNHTTRFLGLGLELETGSIAGTQLKASSADAPHYQDDPVPNASNKPFPETRVGKNRA